MEIKNFKTDFGNIAYYSYLPSNSNHIVIQIAHGMIEHKGRYEWICEELCKNGYSVFINDHRGHGDSIRGDVKLGEMGRDGMNRAADDLFSLYKIIKQDYPDYKHILIGHSMGSLLSRMFLQKYPDKLDALILLGSPSPSIFLDFGIFVLRLLRKIGFSNSPSLGQIFSFQMRFKKKFKNTSSNDWISKDQAVITEFREDVKCQFNFTMNSFINLLKALRQVYSKYPKEIINPHLPILFASGSDDICGDFGNGVLKAYKHIQKQGYLNVDLYLYGDTRHELLNETNKEEILLDLLNWLKNRI